VRLGSSLLALVAATLVMQTVTASPHVSAQTPPVSPDSVPKDSQPEARGPGCEMCMLPVLAVFGAALLVAPPTVMLVGKDTTRRPGYDVGFAGDHFSVYLVGGGSWEKPGLGWTHSESVAALKGRLYGELRFDSFEFSDLGSAHFQTVRAGYLVHPAQPVLGGVTIGYRRARGDSVQNAVEIGLPLVLGTSRGWIRFNPTYLISSAGITWNYSLQMEFPILHTPLVLGFDFEARTLRQDGVYFGTVALVLGTRF